MSSKVLCALVRFAAVATAICGVILCAFVFPSWFGELLPLLFFWAASLPCFVILIYVWLVSTAIARDAVFTLKTARWIRNAAVLLLADVGFFIVGNVVLLALKMNNAEVLLPAILASIFGVSLALLAAVLSRYITKAAVLQEDIEGTI
jgi:hypothetical protein